MKYWNDLVNWVKKTGWGFVIAVAGIMVTAYVITSLVNWIFG